MKFEAAELTLNLEAPVGAVTVQILDPDGKPLRGFTRKDCQPISGDSFTAPVRWKKSLSNLQGKSVRLEFFLKDARLYSFELRK